MNRTMLQAAGVGGPIDAMSPGRMIVALYERLAVDLERAGLAIEAADAETAHDCLGHARSIVAELHDSLDTERWPAAERLRDIYVFLLLELATADVEDDTARIASCHALVVPLRDAWIEAAGIVPSAGRRHPARPAIAEIRPRR